MNHLESQDVTFHNDMISRVISETSFGCSLERKSNMGWMVSQMVFVSVFILQFEGCAAIQIE